jgi:AcrR family transcriptional regulator
MARTSGDTLDDEREGRSMPKIVDHDERRQVIIDGMRQVVARDGFDAVSIRSIATEVGLSKSTIAHYFADRAELLEIAVSQQTEATLSEFAKINRNACTPDIALKTILAAIPTTAKRRKQSQVWLALLQECGTNPQAAASLAQLNKEVRQGLLMVLEALAENGYVATDRDLSLEAAKLHGLIDGLSLQTLTDPRGTSKAAVERSLAAALSELRS